MKDIERGSLKLSSQNVNIYFIHVEPQAFPPVKPIKPNYINFPVLRVISICSLTLSVQKSASTLPIFAEEAEKFKSEICWGRSFLLHFSTLD